MSTDLDEQVRAARVRRHGSPPPGPPDDRTVQLAVRLPEALRQQVHRAAAASGKASTQEWLQEVIEIAIADVLDPQRRVAAVMRETLLSSLADQIDAGAYDAFLAELAKEDPDLA